MTLDTLEKDLEPEEYEQLELEATTACRDRLVSEGVNLSAFNSLQNAADIDALRRALGYEQINLYGVSYGTLLALHTIRDYPEGLRSVILDAVVPPQINYLTRTGMTAQRSFDRLFEACASDPACNEAYPDLQSVFFDLVDQFNETPAIIPMTDPDSGIQYDAVFDGDSFMGSIFQLLYSGGMVPSLPRMIYEARDGEFDAFARIMSIVLFDRSMSYGMFYSVLCAEDADFSLADQQLEGVYPEIARQEKRSLPLFLEVCERWDVTPLGDQVDLPVESSIPTLVLSGEFDPVTPPEYAAEAASSLSNSYVYTFPTGAHGAAMDGICQDQIINAFLDNPGQAPDGSCIAEEPTVEFFTPATVIDLPVIIDLVNLGGTSGVELLLLVLFLVLLMTSLLVLPLIWLIQKVVKKPKPVEDGIIQPETHLSPVLRFAGWAPVITSILLIAFLTGLTADVFRLAFSYDNRLLYGVSGQIAWVFILPLIALLLTIWMIVATIIAWKNRTWNIWYRIYFSILTLASVGCMLILAKWQVFTALF